VSTIQGQPATVIPSARVSGFPNVLVERLGELPVSEWLPRFAALAWSGQVYSFGLALTSINNATFTSATLGATCTPIAGIWNPTGSGVNGVVLQATLTAVLTALTATGPGSFAWYSSVGNTAQPSTGSKGINRVTLAAGGSIQGVSGVALTGLTNNLTLLCGSALTGGVPVNTSQTYTVAGIPQQGGAASVENLDGSIIVPPGGVLALLAQTTPVAHSAVSGIIWAQTPV
jgi:hypothetical protein